MPDLKRLLLASAAVVLLAAIAGGQQTSPFRQPPRMPPEIMAAPKGGHHVSFRVEIDNQQMRVTRYTLEPRDRWIVPSGALLVAVTDLNLQTRSGMRPMAGGETRWIEDSATWVHNLASTPYRYLVIEPKRN
jgi:hypothetical protein